MFYILVNPNLRIDRHLFLRNACLDFCDKNPKIKKRNILEENTVSFVLTLSVCVLLQSRTFSMSFAVFDPKSRDMASLKRHFLKNFTTNFSDIFFCEDVELMLNMVT